jgi:acetyl-CoA decarbonylase/synthase complex subunit delta
MLKELLSGVVAVEKDKEKIKNKLMNDLANLLGNKLLEVLEKHGEFEIVLEDAVIEVDELRILIQPSLLRRMVEVPAVEEAVGMAVTELIETKFAEPEMKWDGKIVEVNMGATPSEGGTRDRSFTIGGETMPPIYRLLGVEEAMPHRPVIAMDVFDMRIPLPKSIKLHFDEVMDDPAEWAKRCVNKYHAEMINLHLISTDPYIKDTPANEAIKVVEDVMQAVKVPITVGGSGNPEKDQELFIKISDIVDGEKVLLNSLNLDMKLEDIAEYIRNKDCIVIAFTPMDLDKARELNRKLFDYLPRERIIMDTNTAGIGYGLDYGFSVMERARLAALMGDKELQQPIAAGVTNAWAAREAWLKMDVFWGPREIRGPLWETSTALINLLAGADYFMMMHPFSIETLNKIIDYLMRFSPPDPGAIMDWVGSELG